MIFTAPKHSPRKFDKENHQAKDTRRAAVKITKTPTLTLEQR